ncbi:TetR/AcrR family transcriptional regulator [Amycolatopsis sp.]|uniref:TetR/AcrR family transcriptional regulator n=1 Tax=Amycolatopsis sp. TaxID=37632 RepID=UPI002BEC943B|nr:TetR/AcrR family transcriptional regulator [Amycolatopsis sp.]HVV12013.1 TetR/AcrR family transcriptional regulator [Amycolatopsis sp.]
MPRLADTTRSARRAQIVAAAVRCFARAGYHATTMADVATEAGVSKGTPYLYFPSKQALFLALYAEWDCGLADRVDAALDALPEHERRSPRRVLHTVATTVGAHVVDQPDTCRVLMEARTLAAYHPEIATAVRASNTRTHEQLEDLFRAGIAAGEWTGTTDPALAARLFTATLYGLMAEWHLDPHSISWRAVAAAVTSTPAARR